MDGANIASRTGDGEAYLMNWNGVNNTLNKLYQKDIYESRYRRAAFDRANIELQKAGTGVRPQDIPSITNHYNNWKNAETALLDPKVQQNPELRQKFTAASNEAHTSYMAEAADSKAFAKEFPAYKLKILEDKGHNYDLEGLKPWEEEINNLPTKEIRAKGKDVPTHLIYGNDGHDPKKYEADVFGKRITKTLEAPGAIDPTTHLPVEYIQTAKELPAYDDAEVANRAANEIAGNSKLQRDAVREYQSTDHAIVKQAIDTAKSLIKQHPHNGETGAENTLNYDDPYSYKIAQSVIANQPKDLGEVGRRVNSLHTNALSQIQHKEDKAQQQFYQNANLAIAKRRLGIDEEKWHATKQKLAAGTIPFDIAPMYESANNPNKQFKTQDGKTISGKDKTDAYLQTIVQGNPKELTGVTITADDLYDPSKLKAITEKLGVPMPVTKFGGGISQDEARNRMLQSFVDNVKQKYPDQLDITPEHLKEKAIPVIIRKSFTKDMNGNLTPQRTATTFNPATNNIDEFKARASHEIAQKKAAAQKEQGANLEDNLGDLSADYVPPAPAPKKQNVAQKAASKVKAFFLKQ